MFLYSNNEYMEIEIKDNTIYNHSKKNEKHRYELNKHVQVLYTENYKTLTKEIKDNLN